MATRNVFSPLLGSSRFAICNINLKLPPPWSPPIFTHMSSSATLSLCLDSLSLSLRNRRWFLNLKEIVVHLEGHVEVMGSCLKKRKKHFHVSQSLDSKVRVKVGSCYFFKQQQQQQKTLSTLHALSHWEHWLKGQSHGGVMLKTNCALWDSEILHQQLKKRVLWHKPQQSPPLHSHALNALQFVLEK